MKITFEREKEVIGQLDKSVLELALENGIPMLNACKGKARCSTCRVLVLNGTPHERTEKEAFLAQRLGLPDNVRLSCQLTTDEPLQVRRLLMDDVDRKYMNQAKAYIKKHTVTLDRKYILKTQRITKIENIENERN